MADPETFPTRRRTLQAATAAGAIGWLMPRSGRTQQRREGMMADLILRDGRITSLDRTAPEAEAIAITDGRVQAVGSTEEIMRLAGDTTEIVDLAGRRVIPGLNDSHTHLIRGGLNYNMELRWEGVPSLADGLRMLKQQADRTPAPQWVRVVGGWSEYQFAERRMPTLAEINAAAPDTPVFILHLYGRALLNRAALAALGFTRDTPDPPGGEIQRGAKGEPTGLLIAKPSALILYSTLARGPRLPLEGQINSTRHYMREMNRLGITSVIDAGGGGQNFPEDYAVIQRLHDAEQLTVRIVYGDGGYADRSPPLPPASPSWSPVNVAPSPAMRAEAGQAVRMERACHDGCANACGVHGHDHRIAWTNPIPVADLKAFWGVLGCSCFAV